MKRTLLGRPVKPPVIVAVAERHVIGDAFRFLDEFEE